MTLHVTYKLGATDNKKQYNNQLVATEKLMKNKHILLTVMVKTGHALSLLFGLSSWGHQGHLHGPS